MAPDQTITTPISGFATPLTGPVFGRISMCAAEGDPGRSGEQVLFGQTVATLLPISGPNNFANNFFASQINNELGLLDTTGTFGTRNHINGAPGTLVVGGRQGWDVTAVDVSPQLVNNQTSAVLQFRTSSDAYLVVGVGFSIEINAPFFVLTKSASVSSAAVGDVLTYTTNIVNSGTAAAGLSFFADPVPAGTQFIAGSVVINGVPTPAADPSVGIPLGTLAPGGAAQVAFQVQVTAITVDGVIRNRSRIDFSYQIVSGGPFQTGSTPSNVVITDLQIPGLTLAKSVTPNRSPPGDTVTYTIVVTNSGQIPLTNIMIDDPLISFHEELSSLAPGASTSLFVNYVIPTGILSGTVITNTAVAISDQTDSVEAQANVSVLSLFEIRVTKVPDRLIVLPGDTVTYTITADNLSNTAITQVVINDSLTNFFAIIPFMAPGESRSFTTEYTVPSGTFPGSVITNTAAMSPLETNAVFDQASIVVTSLTELFIIKQVNRPLAAPGDTVEYTIVVTNVSDTELTNVVIEDATLGINQTFAALAPSASITLNATFTIPRDAVSGQVFRNLSTTFADGIEPLSANADVLVAARPAITLTKSVVPEEAAPGSSVTYLFQITNSGNTSLEFVTLTDPLLGLSQTIGTLAASESAVVPFPFVVPASATDPFVNNATVTASFESESVSAVATAALRVQQADFTIVKSVDPSEAAPGQEVSFSYLLTNTGPLPLTNIAVTDPALGYSILIPLLESGDFVSAVIPFTVPANALGGDVIQNIITALPEGGTPQQASSFLIVRTLPAMTIEKSVTPASALPGAVVTYTITVTNIGNTVLHDIGVGDGLLGLNDSFSELAIGASQTYTIPFQIPLDAPVGSIITNTSTAVSDETESLLATAAVRVAAAPLVLNVSKTVDRPSAAPGETVQFIVEIANPETETITGVALFDPLLQVDSTIGSLSPGQTVQFPFVFVVPLNARAGETINNTAFVISNETEEVEASASIIVTAFPPSLALEKTVTPAQARPGEAVTFRLRLSNTGNTDLTNVVLADSVLQVALQIPVLAARAFQIFSATFIVPNEPPGTIIHNVATAASDQLPEQTASADLVVLPAHEVNLSKRADRAEALPGETVFFTINFANLSNAALTNVQFEDPLFGLIQTAAVVPAGFTAQLELSYVIPEGTAAGTVIVNEVFVRADEVGERRASASVTAGPLPRLEISKQVRPQSVLPGQTVFFILRGTNTGNTPLTNVHMLDPMLQLEAVIGTLNVNESQSIVISYVIPDDAVPGTDLVNTFVIVSDELGGQLATATVHLSPLPLELRKTVSASTVSVGEIFDIALQAVNTGEHAALDVIITDQLAGEFTFVPGSVTVDDRLLPNASPLPGIPAGILEPGQSAVIRFRAEANAVPHGGKADNQGKALFRAVVNGRVFQTNSNVVEIEVEEGE
ncbi:DUF7507 domain-containing protein [Paenibacillus protaetiae]|uniref:DUF11 domain-containing protein n=1 Tax=Paenibacillus protaetiae TaxID=2509456 RepID=A0A4P6ESM0_9BACL|nr:DUF11 domain-containing protein [Paenibacillus protaetiae]QAY65894.1 DUF11 domain-containing protein [Paenibacillus protaetiae]